MDLNPDFVFDVADERDNAWELTAALQHGSSQDRDLTSIDDKIAAQVARMGPKHGSRTRARGKKRPREAQQGESSDETDDLSDDVPLPGEDFGSGSEEEPGAVADESASLHASVSEQSDAESADSEIEHEAVPNALGDASLGTTKTAAAAELRIRYGALSRAASTKARSARGHLDAVTVDRAPRKEEADGVGTASAKKQAPSAAPDGGRSRSAGFFADAPSGTKFTAGSFADLGLSRPLVKACTALGYTAPTPIQAACVPLALLGRDIVGSAQTGSGKTAAFALPLLERLLFRQKRVIATYVLVLTPTRELAAQIHGMICKLAQFTDIRAALVVGGLSLQKQAAELRGGPEIVVATPGRLIDHVMNTMSFELDSLSALVLDEADRLLELGFAEEIKQLVKLAPQKRQTLLFSATMTDEVQTLVTVVLSSPVRLAADRRAAAPASLRQEVVRLKGASAASKAAALFALCARSLAESRTIIFCQQKHKVHELKILMGLAQLPPASELHGDMTQTARLDALEAFRTGASRILLATDVAARGLDIPGVQTVVNFDAPRTIDTYMHRIGRTARAGAAGLSITFVEDSDRPLLRGIVKQVSAALSNRIVPKPVINSWHRRLEALQDDLQSVLQSVDDELREQDERQERAFRKAEMEASKAENLVLHEAEISARPRREWFLTEKQKRGIAAAAAAAAPASDSSEARSAAPRKEQQSNVKGKQRSEKRKGAPVHVSESEREMGAVRAAKSAARKLREGGQRPKEASKAALSAVGVKTRAKQKKARAVGPENAADADMIGRTRVYAGGGTSGIVKRTSTTLSKTAKAQLARKGKGKHQFKGKARFKRRK